MIIALVMFTFGFAGRNIICKPLVYLDDDPLFNVIIILSLVVNTIKIFLRFLCCALDYQKIRCYSK